MLEQSYPGSRWWKFDFHSHTPASLDYRGDKNISPQGWLQNFQAKGVQCVVVCDHNTGAWIDKLKEALSELKQQDAKTWQEFSLFPGMEISCDGGVHLIAIFDPSKDTADLDALRGSVAYRGTPGDSDGVTSLSVQDVISEVHKVGGLACAAHIDMPNGLLTSVQNHHTLEAICAKLDAVEVIDANAEIVLKNVGRLAKFAQVLGSDSHKPSAVGRGFNWVKMSQPNLDGLRLALLDPEAAIQRGDQQPSEPQALPKQWITSIRLENLHLRRTSALNIHFNPAYNAIIGGRGSGKSTVLECLRLALAREGELHNLEENSEIRKIFQDFKKKYVQRDQPGMMRDESQISVEMLEGNGPASQRYQLLWCYASPGVQLSRWEDDAWQATGFDQQQINAKFPIKIFSQKQVLALANNPQSVLAHIDNSIAEQKRVWLENFERSKSTLLAARLRVRTLRKELEKKPALELEYKEARRKALIFTNSNFGPLLKKHQRATQQKRALDDFYQLLANDIAGLQTGIAQAANLSSTELTQFLAETPAEIDAQLAALGVKNRLVQQYEQIVAIAAQMKALMEQAEATRLASSWQQENDAPIQAYLAETARLKSEGINSAQEAGMAVATEEKLRKQLEQMTKFAEELQQAEQNVSQATDALSTCRQELTQIRTEFITQLLGENAMLKIQLRAMASCKSDVQRFRGILKLGSGDTFAQHIWQEDEEGKSCGILSDAVASENTALIPDRITEIKLALEEINQKTGDGTVLNTRLGAPLLRRIEALPAEALDELAWWFPEDEVVLFYRPNKKAAFKALTQASAGQKTAAMLSFLLMHGDEPLLLDQPEDDLDNAIVSELVVEQLRQNKVHRQLIVITHNANIVVNADADLVMTMDFNGQIDLELSGGLQETSVRQAICRVMEGGETAFRQRYKRILEDLEERE